MKYDIITIEREYASGGREIGKRLAEELHIPFYGREILQMAADRIGAKPEYIEHMDETAPNSLLFSLYTMSSATPFNATAVSPENSLHQTECQIIRELALQGPCVIIGRCAGGILRDNPRVLRVFVHANMDFRRQRATEVYGQKKRPVDPILRKYDKRRANYYNFYSTQKWDFRGEYHLMLDSSQLGIDGCVKILLAALQEA